MTTRAEQSRRNWRSRRNHRRLRAARLNPVRHWEDRHYVQNLELRLRLAARAQDALFGYVPPDDLVEDVEYFPPIVHEWIALQGGL